MNISVRKGKVKFEGDELYFDVRGQGEPLLMIPGGGGDGKWYLLVANILSDTYKVILYDRRANARSTMNHPEHFDIQQQSRDAAAVIHAAGEESAFIFGNSSGAVIALDMAITQPLAVKAVIAHEPPLAYMHPKRKKWRKFFAKVYLTGLRFGGSVAMFRFIIGAGLWHTTMQSAKAVKVFDTLTGAEDKKEERINTAISAEYFANHELLATTNYYPDFNQLTKNGKKIILAAGEESLSHKKFYAQTVQILAEKIGCETVLFPGHHGSFMDMPQEWAASLRQALDLAK